MKITVVFSWSFMKLTMTWNQKCLKANKQRVYSKLTFIEKYSYYPYLSEYQPAIT
jgi:hypothetical protein